jgi:hypothetical protein
MIRRRHDDRNASDESVKFAQDGNASNLLEVFTMASLASRGMIDGSTKTREDFYAADLDQSS